MYQANCAKIESEIATVRFFSKTLARNPLYRAAARLICLTGRQDHMSTQHDQLMEEKAAEDANPTADLAQTKQTHHTGQAGQQY